MVLFVCLKTFSGICQESPWKNQWTGKDGGAEWSSYHQRDSESFQRSLYQGRRLLSSKYMMVVYSGDHSHISKACKEHIVHANVKLGQSNHISNHTVSNQLKCHLKWSLHRPSMRCHISFLITCARIEQTVALFVLSNSSTFFSAGCHDVQACSVWGQKEAQKHAQNQKQKHPEGHTQCNKIHLTAVSSYSVLPVILKYSLSL